MKIDMSPVKHAPKTKLTRNDIDIIEAMYEYIIAHERYFYKKDLHKNSFIHECGIYLQAGILILERVLYNEPSGSYQKSYIYSAAKQTLFFDE
jgi:hypothetical protein